MLGNLETPPDDPILALAGLARADGRLEKLDLGIGIYIDENGNSPVMSAVRRAEQHVLDRQTSKAYLSARGNAAFLDLLGERIFADIWREAGGRIGSLQSTGCVAALRLAGEVLRKAGVGRIWLSDPTWPIHAPILGAAGMQPVAYPYYRVGDAGVDWKSMRAALENVRAGDAVLLHGCCHNPSGADLDVEQWREIGRLLSAKGAIALIDIAYAGLGDGWDEDLAGVRAILQKVAEAVVAVSCSKSFGLYRERTGAIYFVAETAQAAAGAVANGMVAARTSYSMSPDHGAATVAEILGDPDIDREWAAELASMRERIARLRHVLAAEAARAGMDWSYLKEQRGMFSLLPLAPEQVARLRDDYAIYMPANGRVCLPGLSEQGCRYLAESCAKVLGC